MEGKKSRQFRALFRKNLVLQSKQPCTNICQIITPIICLVFTILIRNIAIANIPNQQDNLYTERPMIPIKFNDYSIFEIKELQPLIKRSCLQWYLIHVEKNEDMAFLGVNDGHKRTGLLGNVTLTHKYFTCPFNNSYHRPFRTKYVQTPFYMPTKSTVNQQLFKILNYLNTESFATIVAGMGPLDKLPDGSITFKTATKEKLQMILSINDVRWLQLHRNDGITQIQLKTKAEQKKYQKFYTIKEGYLTAMDSINQAYIKTLTGETIVSGIVYMPVLQNTSEFIQILISSIAAVLFPLSLSLLLPVFIYNIVLEKEERLIQMMKINGMKMQNYWIVNFIFDFIMSVCTNLVFCVFGYLFLQNPIFHQTSLLLLAIILLGWILAQIGMAMFFQVFLSDSKAANIIGYLITIWTNLIGATINVALYQYPQRIPLVAALWPTFSFNRIFYLMFTKCSDDHCYSSLSSLDYQMVLGIIVIYISSIIFSLLGVYLHQIVPQEYGVRRGCCFPIKKCLPSEEPHFEEPYDELDAKVHDLSIQNEIRTIQRVDHMDRLALACMNLTKVYSNGKVAVQNFNLTVEDKQIFGLLGPNGAGKTTLLSMITGIYQPTKGEAFISGYSINNNIEMVYLQMGVCPQFDLLWPSLSVEDHLYFYTRIKGIEPSEQANTVEEILREVNLLQFRKFNVSQLSGGMKRRLSIAISLAGNPRIVFLDQPTTGLDPENRRNLWELLSKCREKRSLFITTHLMEQAETLCDKIGIIAQGILRTVGNQFQLKKAYGQGYFLTISSQMVQQHKQSDLEDDLNFQQDQSMREPSVQSDLITSMHADSSAAIRINLIRNAQQTQHIKQAIEQILPQAVLVKEINGTLKFSLGEVKASEILKKMNTLQTERKIDWSVTNSTLEDVFIEVVETFQIQQEEDIRHIHQ